MVVSAFFLYIILSSFLSVANTVTSTDAMKQELFSAQENIRIASQNINNQDTFTINIDQASEVITVLESEKLFLSDVQVLKDRIGILQKQFNGIEAFVSNSENTMYSFGENGEEIVKIVSINSKVYVIHPESITGPIFSGQSAEKHIFQNMSDGDRFVDATVYDTDIILLTETGKVVNFAKNNFFSYTDVLDQAKWEDSPIIVSYLSNLYLLSDQENQILRHKKQGQNYAAGEAFLSDEDSIDIGRILSIAIDG